MKLKDKKIELLRPVIAKDSEGFKVEELVPAFPDSPTVWAYFRQLLGREIAANSATFPHEEVLFVVNWRAGLDSGIVVRFRGRVYEVTRVDVYEGYRGEVGLWGHLKAKER